MFNRAATPRSLGKTLRSSTALLSVALAAAVTFVPITTPGPSSGTAQAQGVSISVQFRGALAPHGRWIRHNRWGEVWIPARRDRDWRPYTVGRWVFTDEWGWFWVSDEDGGWITYHYGRWVLDPRFGWLWIPGDEWGPAWVQWRRGDRHAGWAPLAPQAVIYDYDDDPNYWIFVSFNNFTAPRIHRVLVPRRERVVYIQQTVIVNRTIIVEGDRGPRIAVNPGIEPRIVAARMGKPIQVVNVKPAVVAGTVGVQNAVEIRADQPAKQRERVRVEVAEKKETIAPAKDVPPPQALKKGEEGRLGDRPPEAAKQQAQQPTPAPGAPKGEPKDKGAPKDKGLPADKGAPKAEPKTEPKAEPKAAPKAEPKDKGVTKEKAEPKQLPAPKAPEPKGEPKDKAAPKAGAAQKAPEPKSAPEPKQAAPKAPPPQATPKAPPPQAQPKAPPPQAQPKAPAPQAQPKAAAPKAPPAAPPPQAAPKAPAPKGAPKGRPEEKGKGG